MKEKEIREMVRQVARSMALEGQATSLESQERLVQYELQKKAKQKVQSKKQLREQPVVVGVAESKNHEP